MRNGPNGEFQLTPMPIARRGFQVSPTKNSLKAKLWPSAVFWLVVRQAGGLGLIGLVTCEVAVGVQTPFWTVAVSTWL